MPILLEAGAKVNAQSEVGKTALMLATEAGHRDCVDLLLRDKNVDVNCRDEYGKTALMYAAEEGREAAHMRAET